MRIQTKEDKRKETAYKHMKLMNSQNEKAAKKAKRKAQRLARKITLRNP
jgi:hypothetical protein